MGAEIVKQKWKGNPRRVQGAQAGILGCIGMHSQEKIVKELLGGLKCAGALGRVLSYFAASALLSSWFLYSTFSTGRVIHSR